jgi:hypothetical protein
MENVCLPKITKIQFEALLNRGQNDVFSSIQKRGELSKVQPGQLPNSCDEI